MTNISELMAFLVQSEEEHRSCAKALAADSRGDEADFEKIRANVFGIFRAVLETAAKLHGESVQAEDFFVKKLREIPAAWRAALVLSGEKGDNEAAFIEKLKLDAVSRIDKFMKGEGR